MYAHFRKCGEHRLTLCLMKNSQTKICVPVCVSRADELADAIRRASEVADIIELRLDYLDNSALILIKQNLSTHLNELKLPKILTLRSVDQGGSASLKVDERYNFWSSLTKLPDDCLIDLEHDLAIKFANEESGRDLPTNWDHVICSYHDFVGVPSDLEQIYARM